MKYTQLVFSPTGGTEKVINAITKGFEGVQTIDLTTANDDFSKYSFTGDDVVFVAMPSFGGLAPQTALDRFAQVKGDGAKCVIVAVYGNREFEDTLVQMEDTAEKCGFKVIAAVSAVAEHSVVRTIAAGRPDSDDCAELSDFAQKITDKLKSDDFTKPTIPGNRPYKTAGKMGMVPMAGEGCVACGLCAEKCPVQAIDKNDVDNVDKDKCISCLRCGAVCPKGVRAIDAAMAAAVSNMLSKVCAERKRNELFI